MLHLFSPAKINLFFKMMGLRKDGFHNLSSFFQAINLGDDIFLSKSLSDQYTSNESLLPFNAKNFIYLALKLFREKTKIKDPVKIELIKKIPMGAGLGGGSSNIATILWGLNELFGGPATLSELKKWGAELGSDVPFFFSTGSAICTGRGEKITESKRPDPEESVWLVKPSFSMCTKEVYTFAKKKSRIKFSSKELLEALYSKNPIYENDLEDAAFLISPKLALLKDELIYQGFKQVFMTGSGSAFVCFGNLKPKFKNPVQIFKVQYINKGINQWYLKESYVSLSK